MTSTTPISDRPALDSYPAQPELLTAERGASGPTTPEPGTVERKAFSVSSLVLGISSLAFGYTVIVPIVGLVLGILALRREPANRAMSIWGIALSGIVLFGGLVAILFGITLLVPLGIASALSG